MSPVSTPASAYRADTATAPADPRAELWLRVASELRLGARSSGDAQRDLLAGALALVVDHFGEDTIDEWAASEYGRELGFVEPALFLAHQMLERGAINLTGVLLDDLLAAATTLTDLQRGRVLALRARVSWKLGQHDDSADRFREVERLGVRHHLPELVARASNGIGTVAQLRGNYPEMRAYIQRAADIADAESLISVSRMGHHGLMILAGRDGRFDDAVREGLQVLQHSRGHAEWEAEVLQTFGQLLLAMGRPDGARACFAAVMTRSTRAHVVMPSLGGLAMASAITGREPTLEWAAREVWASRQLGASPYYAADALVECGAALARIGRVDEATKYIAEGAAIATRFGFHELLHRAETLPHPVADAKPSAPLETASEDVVGILRGMEPAELPRHVMLEALP